MIAENTKAAIIALLAVDAGATDGERLAVRRVLEGRRTPRAGVVRLRDAAARIGRHYNTVRKLIKTGRISPVYGTGKTIMGISEESLERFMEGEAI